MALTIWEWFIIFSPFWMGILIFGSILIWKRRRIIKEKLYTKLAKKQSIIAYFLNETNSLERDIFIPTKKGQIKYSSEKYDIIPDKNYMGFDYKSAIPFSLYRKGEQRPLKLSDLTININSKTASEYKIMKNVLKEHMLEDVFKGLKRGGGIDYKILIALIVGWVVSLIAVYLFVVPRPVT